VHRARQEQAILDPIGDWFGRTELTRDLPVCETLLVGDMLIHRHDHLKPSGFGRQQKSSVLQASETGVPSGLAVVFMEEMA
jgi:hypothetical protein